MGKKLNGMMVSEGNQIFYDSGFRACLESHLHLLKNPSNGRELMLTPDEAYRFEFDLNGLLYAKQVPVYMHWVVMRANGYASPSELTQDTESLFIPSETAVDRIRTLYQTNPK